MTRNGDDVLTQNEFTVVPGSLLGKAAVAQAVFDGGFLLPFAPDAPEFFLIPGDNQVTVMWRPSPSEAAGDPFFAIAKPGHHAGAAVNPNPLYDPNYRQFDVEGYRIYRGRVDAPNALRLLAQFDYAGTVMTDFAGQVNPVAGLRAGIGLTAGCPVVFDPVGPGVAPGDGLGYPAGGAHRPGEAGRPAAAGDRRRDHPHADTIPTGNAAWAAARRRPVRRWRTTGCRSPSSTTTVRNNFRYFYSVTAFDVNSFQSGPSNLESARVTKPVIPVRPAANYENTALLGCLGYGPRGASRPTSRWPSIDPETGTFSKKIAGGQRRGPWRLGGASCSR